MFVKKILWEKACHLLSQFGLSKVYLVRLVYNSYYLVRSPSTAFELEILIKIWLGASTNYIGFKLFVCPMCACTNDGTLLGFEFGGDRLSFVVCSACVTKFDN